MYVEVHLFINRHFPWCDEILLSRIPGHHEGNIYFPKEFQYYFTLVKRIPYETFTLEIYHRN